MRLPSALCLAGLLSAALCLPASADVDFTVEGRPYRLVTTLKNFATAQADAVALGGSLVHIDSEAENAAIFAALQAAVPAGSTAADGGGALYAWIGGTETSEGTYAWTDSTGTPFWTGGNTGSAPAGQYANWGRATAGSAGPEPDNFNTTQNRAAMGFSAWPSSGTAKIGQPGQWNDIRDTNTLASIVEFSGMYATFRMSHGGTARPPFTAKLYFDKAPLTVANFAGLAEGGREFIHEATGSIAKRPYYDGLISHRIIADFMMQLGCPRGNGTSGPGYSIPDEFDSTILHTKAGLLSMANSGPHTGGSQFFITAGATAWLDYKHAVFGEVISGLNDVVLPLINTTPVSGSTPVSTVRIESLSIHRSGAAARAFNTTPAGLARIPGFAPAVASVNGTHCLLTWPREAHHTYVLLQTGDLSTWSMDNSPISMESTAPLTTGPFDTFSRVPAGASRRFFRVPDVVYPTVFSPVSFSSLRLTTSGDPTVNIVHNIGSGTTGDYTATVTGGPVLPGNITDYAWTRSQHGGNLILAVNGISVGGQPVARFDYGLRFTSATGGTYRGILQTWNGFQLNDAIRTGGTFTIQPNP